MSMGAAAKALPVPSFPQLVGETSKDLYRLAVRLTGDRDEADDLLQATYVRAFEALQSGRFRGESRHSTLLYRIVLHVAFDERRSLERRARLHDGAATRASRHAADGSEASVQLRELRDALATLPHDQRTALVLKELHGLTGREVAEVMEKTEGAVEQLLVRSRAALRARFES
jgi:RNA polymerase sigma-70 factor (ECF subfamily)